MRNSKHILTTILVLFLAISAQAQTSVADGNWIDDATWGGTSPGYTALTNPIVNSYVTSNSSLVFDSSPNRTLTVKAGETLIVYGDVTFNSNSGAEVVVEDGGKLVIYGDLSMGKNNAGITAGTGAYVVVTGGISSTGNAGTISGAGNVYSSSDSGNFTGGTGTISPITSNPDAFADGVLPVELVYFRAEKSDNSVVLSWGTAAELNNDYFVIERSLDGVSFEELTTISGNGTSNEPIAYEYVDYAVSSSVVYYRLKQVDFDGAFEYFDVIKVNVGSQTESRIYPTLVSDGEINLRGQDLLEIKIFNTRGDILKSEKVLGLNKIEIHSLENGLYFVQVMAASGAVVTERIVVRR